MNNAILIMDPDPDIAEIVERNPVGESQHRWTWVYIPTPRRWTIDKYSAFCCSMRLWRQLKGYDKVLTVQRDTGILRSGIDEFMEWDYVSAPWRENAKHARKDRRGGNGGLSLRDVRKCTELVRTMKYKPPFGYASEDVWFVHHLDKVGGRVAPYEVCRRFSVENVFELGTYGYHKMKKLTPEQREAVLSQ